MRTDPNRDCWSQTSRRKGQRLEDPAEELSAVEKAMLTAKWAVTMAKWRIAFDTGERVIGGRTVPASRRWNLITFLGPGGSESSGIVDLMAIRKNHKTPQNSKLKRGDLFDIILIQVKGGGARRPLPETTSV